MPPSFLATGEPGCPSGHSGVVAGACTPTRLYIRGDAVLARPYLHTITHCYPSDVTVSPVTVHRRQSYYPVVVAVLRCLDSLPRPLLPFSSSISILAPFFHTDRLSQYRGYRYFGESSLSLTHVLDYRLPQVRNSVRSSLNRSSSCARIKLGLFFDQKFSQFFLPRR